MELTEEELKGLQNLLIKDNHQNIKKRNNNIILKSNELNKNKRKLFSSLPKIQKNNVKVDVVFKYHQLSLNNTKKFQTENNNIIIKNTIIKSNNSSKKERSLIVKNILNEIKRKPNDNSPKSSNTYLNSYGELYPGPGSYDVNKNDIGIIHNLRYKNLFANNSHRYKNINKLYERNIGPGSYNPTENYNYISYAQNPKVFISSLDRPSFINENEINKNVGPGTYEIDSSFQRIKNIKTKNNSTKLNNKKEKLQKWLKSELSMRNNTNFFNLENDKKLISIKKNIINENNKNNAFNVVNKCFKKNIGEDDINFRFNSIQNSRKSFHKKYLLDKNKSKRKCFTNNNIEYNFNKEVFPIINKKYI